MIIQADISLTGQVTVWLGKTKGTWTEQNRNDIAVFWVVSSETSSFNFQKQQIGQSSPYSNSFEIPSENGWS